MPRQRVAVEQVPGHSEAQTSIAGVIELRVSGRLKASVTMSSSRVS